MKEEVINDILTRGIANVIPDKKSLEEKLLSGKKLNIYMGIDPTATQIHLGHAVPLRKLQQFVHLGHKVTFLIGDFTALIGDTSDKTAERRALTYKEVQDNFKTYKKQASKIVDFSKVKVVFNSSWLNKLTFQEIISLCQMFSVGDFTSRELIRDRLNVGKRVGLHETLYPVMQGYDSYHLDTDLQIGGADQTFNMQAGRTLLSKLKNKDSFVLVTDYLIGTDGTKMSKSIGNAIWLNDTPQDIYGKIMSLGDELIMQYFTLGTTLPLDEVKKIKGELDKSNNPIAIKQRLAFTVVSELHNSKEAQKAQEYFENTFQKREIPKDIPTFKTKEKYIEDILLSTNTISSKSEVKRLIFEGAIEVNGEKISKLKHKLSTSSDGLTVKIGKRNFIKIFLEK